MIRTAETRERAADVAAAVQAARALERWGSARGWRGPDPYDALNARRLPGEVRRSPLALRVVTQAVKRSPVNLRPLLAIPDGLSAATLAHVISAYARNDGFMDDREASVKLRRLHRQPRASSGAARFPSPAGVTTSTSRRGSSSTRAPARTRSRPPSPASACSTHTSSLAMSGRLSSPAVRPTSSSAMSRRPRVGPGPTSATSLATRTPIHNANMLVCALLARLAATLDDEDLAARSRGGTAWTVARQRPDGSWPYGERTPPQLGRRLSHRLRTGLPADLRDGRRLLGRRNGRLASRHPLLCSRTHRARRDGAVQTTVALSGRRAMRRTGNPDTLARGTARAGSRPSALERASVCY